MSGASSTIGSDVLSDDGDGSVDVGELRFLHHSLYKAVIAMYNATNNATQHETQAYKKKMVVVATINKRDTTVLVQKRKKNIPCVSTSVQKNIEYPLLSGRYGVLTCLSSYSVFRGSCCVQCCSSDDVQGDVCLMQNQKANR